MREQIKLFYNDIRSNIEEDVNQFLKDLAGELLDITYQVKEESHHITLTYRKPKKSPVIPQIKILKAKRADTWSMQEQLHLLANDIDGTWKKTIHSVSGNIQYVLIAYEKEAHDGGNK